MDISARALLVNTTVRVWTGEKRDRAITREICTMKGAEDNAVRANKSLLGEHIHGVQAAERAVRHAVNERTLPWMDDGTRILKGAVFMAFTEAMAEPIRQFDEAVEAFIAAYPEIKHEARRRLGDAYADSDFPAESSLKQRADLSAGAQHPGLPREPLRGRDRGGATQRRRSPAWHGQRCTAFAARPPAGTGCAHGNAPAAVPPHVRRQGTASVPRQPLVENVRAIVRLAPALNLMDDPRIAALCADIERNLTGHDSEQLRNSDALRESVANEADAIRKRMQGAFA
jgi:hypothetical protein